MGDLSNRDAFSRKSANPQSDASRANVRCRTYAVRCVARETTRNVLVRVRSIDQQRDVDLDIFERRRSRGERGVGVHQRRNRLDDDCAIPAVLAGRSALSRVRTPLLLAQRKRADAYALSHAEGEKATLKKDVSLRAVLTCLRKSRSIYRLRVRWS